LIITWILFGIKHLIWLLKTRRRNHLFLRFRSLILLILLLLLFYFAFFIIQHLRSFLWSSGSIFCFVDVMRWIHACYARNMHWISFLDFENLYCDVCFLFCLEGREIKPHNCLRCENIYHCTVIACTSDYVVFWIACCLHFLFSINASLHFSCAGIVWFLWCYSTKCSPLSLFNKQLKLSMLIEISSLPMWFYENFSMWFWCSWSLLIEYCILSFFKIILRNSLLTGLW
jgi:hypothetical protein